jgi:ribonuclease D
VNLPPFKLVTTQKQWLGCLGALRQEPRLAIDLEANSLFAYREQVCLIQISIPGQDYIVDPTANLDLSGLGELLADEKIEKVFHAAEYDLILVKRQYGWTLQNLFDTMWASRILGYPRYGLANLLQDSYGVEQNKKHQKANWCRRPINEQMLAYAQMDTHYLLRLRDQLDAELKDSDCLAEAHEIFADQCHIELSDNNFKPDGFWSINGIRDLSPKKRALVKGLYTFREQQARQLNRPPFKVFNNRTIIELAEAAPKYLEELSHVHGMSTGQIRRYGQSILEVLSHPSHDPAPKRPQPTIRPPDEVTVRYEKLHNWRKSKARDRGVESDVIMSRGALWTLAWANPQSLTELEGVDKIGPWRRETYGQEILALLNKSRPR